MSSKLLSTTYLKICDKTLFYAYFACLGQNVAFWTDVNKLSCVQLKKKEAAFCLNRSVLDESN